MTLKLKDSLNDVFIKDITDWTIPVSNPSQSIIYPFNTIIKQYEHLESYAHRIIAAASRSTQDEFNIRIEGCNLRICRFWDVDNETLNVRRNEMRVRPISEIGLPNSIVKLLNDDDLLRTGLVIVSGSHGGGKSTTCAAIVKHRLEVAGGVARTIEDPIEFPLSGRHGKGVCFQVALKGDVRYNEEIEREIRKAMRGYPTGTNGILMLGEIRDAYTASESLRTSLAGRLLLSTVHANTIHDVIPRLVSRAESLMGQREIFDILKSTLKLIIHQEIVNGKLRVSFLARTSKLSSILHTGKIQNLKDEVARQNQAIGRGNDIEVAYK